MIEIRRATEADLPTVLDIQAELTPSTLERAVPTFRTISTYPDYGVYVAVDDGAIAGTFALLIVDNLGHHCAPFAVLENVVVRTPSRRRGIGRHMLTFAADHARSRACYKLILGSNLKLTDAHRFYEQLGYRRQGHVFQLDLP
jgi:GNAT superfamily N-acetyltransferase